MEFFVTFCEINLRRFLLGYLFKSKTICFYCSENVFIIIISILMSNIIFGFSSLLDCLAVDYFSRRKRFELIYSLWNYVIGKRIYLKLFLKLNQWVLSLSEFYASIVWLEREIWDLYGIKFLFHKDLRRLLTDYGFKGYPLRKDFPLIGYMEVRYDDIILAVIYVRVENSQIYRIYRFINPWGKFIEKDNSHL